MGARWLCSQHSAGLSVPAGIGSDSCQVQGKYYRTEREIESSRNTMFSIGQKRFRNITSILSESRWVKHR